MAAIQSSTSIMKDEYEATVQNIESIFLDNTNLPTDIIHVVITKYFFSEEEFSVKFQLLVSIETINTLFETNNKIMKDLLPKPTFNSGKPSGSKLKQRRGAIAVRRASISNQITANHQAIVKHISEMNQLFDTHVSFGFSDDSITVKVNETKEQNNQFSNKDDEKSDLIDPTE